MGIVSSRDEAWARFSTLPREEQDRQWDLKEALLLKIMTAHYARVSNELIQDVFIDRELPQVQIARAVIDNQLYESTQVTKTMQTTEQRLYDFCKMFNLVSFPDPKGTGYIFQLDRGAIWE